MDKYSKENDITVREMIMLVSMLIIMILVTVGLLNSVGDIAESSLWDMLSLDEYAEAFWHLLGKLCC